MSRRKGGADSHSEPAARNAPERSPMRAPSGGNPSARSVRLSDGTSMEILERIDTVTGTWAPTAARLLLGLVLLWFGYHELVSPGLWTGYVPVLSPTSHVAEVLVLAHGWLLLVIAVALLGGVAPRIAAAVASVLLLEIVVSLAVTGVTDLVLRDVGVLGLAIGVMGATRQRLLLLR
jgi:uncharacterized membrane protein YphA (DoxX/SURF4 family)